MEHFSLSFCHSARVWRTDRQTDGQTALRSPITRCIQCSAVKTVDRSSMLTVCVPCRQSIRVGRTREGACLCFNYCKHSIWRLEAWQNSRDLVINDIQATWAVYSDVQHQDSNNSIDNIRSKTTGSLLHRAVVRRNEEESLLELGQRWFIVQSILGTTVDDDDDDDDNNQLQLASEENLNFSPEIIMIGLHSSHTVSVYCAAVLSFSTQWHTTVSAG